MNKNKIASIVNSKYYPLLLFFVSFVFVTLFSRATSFLYLFEGADPSIFKQMGRAVLKGKILYIDYFDNKGCLLYFIHAFGLWFGGDFAIMMMQVISLTVTLFIWDKMLALYRTAKERVICICIALVLLLCFYGAGDQTQEWCLPFISYPLLVYFCAYKSKSEISLMQMFYIGLCFGIITFIQINNACAFLGFLVYLWTQYLIRKDFRKFFQSATCFVVGWIIIAIPCVLYFYFKADWHGVYEMVYASFLSNLEYMGHQWKPQWLHVVLYFMFVGAVMVIQINNSHKERNIIIPYVISMALFIATFGKLCNSFYLIALIPLCIVCMMTFNFKKQKKTQLVFCGISLISLVFYAGNIAKHIFLQNNKLDYIYNDFHLAIENIPITERESIYNYNLYWHRTHMMEHEGLLQCNRVLYTALLFQLPTLWNEEASKPFIPPKWILLSFDKPYKKDDANFILKYYDLSYSFQYDMEYFPTTKKGERFDICLFSRKD